MPESREEDAHQVIFEHNFQDLKLKTFFKLLALHADATKPEEGIYEATHGHVVQLQPNCNMVRGTRGSQTHLWPSAFAQTPETPNPLPLSNLTLQGSHSASRAIILDFGSHFLKVWHKFILCLFG
jgi:hypothetical protein